MHDVLIKWTGSKKLQSSAILKRFPSRICTYYEPFLGGASVLYALMSSDIDVDKFDCSDINKPLIDIWKLIQSSPDSVFEYYAKQWPFDKAKYYQLREEFNDDHDPKKFFCLLRTCRNGLIRYNRQGKFNSGFHLGRKGMKPQTLRIVLDDWIGLLRNHDVQFSVRDYREVQSKQGDFLYLDPPYRMTGTYYFGEIDFQSFWCWLNAQTSYALSLNGFKNDKDCRIEVPEELYQTHELISNGTNKFDQLVGNHVLARDSLYLKVIDTI